VTLIDRLLATDRADRPARASDVVRELDAVLRALGERRVAPFPPVPTRGRLLYGAIAGVALGGVALMGFMRRSSEAPAQVSPVHALAPSPSIAAPPARPTRVEARLTVAPANAGVMVDGVPAARAGDGAIVLAGEAGSAFDVKVTAGSRSTTEHVVLLRDGRSEPAIIELPREEAPRARRAPRADATKVRGATAEGAATAPAAAATASSESPHEIVPKDEF
jgi:hypothetical protein